jgi:(E)-4-hydroxy-3-methylbut-2-enyl-diphosphate synthase
MNKTYCPSLTEYQRRVARVVNIGDLPLGGTHPIRVQSMTTVDTMDTLGSVEQTLRMVAAGCEYVRITAPSIKEAQNLLEIKKELRKRGCHVPLIADIHFTPNAAELAARIVEKVRVNPGNYADKKKFEEIEYTDATYAAEVERIRERFRPLVKICKQYGTAMRIGTNHGSLSDRILSRYGDTPLGMVESALEFLRLCEEENYYDVVLSMKASNTQVMVQAYRLLVQKLDEEGLQPYPLHLGVTEAGEAEDGRIKSAVGIGTLLEDGLGDTVRVSLTEAPEAEAPVAKMLIDRYANRAATAQPMAPLVGEVPINPFSTCAALPRKWPTWVGRTYRASSPIFRACPAWNTPICGQPATYIRRFWTNFRCRTSGPITFTPASGPPRLCCPTASRKWWTTRPGATRATAKTIFRCSRRPNTP